MKTRVSLVAGASLSFFFVCALLVVVVVVAENYPNNFEFVQQDEYSSTTSAGSKRSSAGSGEAVPVAEWKSATEFAKVKPNNYPNFAFTKSEPAGRSSSSKDAALAAAEVKPNNYPNFEFRGTEDVNSKEEVKGASTSDVRMTSFETVPEYKPNNYPNFEFKESTTAPVVMSRSAAHDSFRQFTVPKARDSFGASFATEEVEGEQASSQSSTSAFTHYESAFHQDKSAPRTGSTAYRGSDASGRYASSFDLTNARHQAEVVRVASTQGSHFSNSGYGFSTAAEAKTTPSTSTTMGRGGSNAEGESSTNTQAAQFRSDKTIFDEESSAYRFNGANKNYNTDETTSSSSYSSSSFPSFSHDTKETSSANDFSTAAATDHEFRHVSSSTTTSRGCPTSYWSSHLSKWPSFFTVNSKVSDAFPGAKVHMIYGTTTLLQALFDTRADGYSKLMNHGVAALLNAYEMSSGYQYSHTTVIELFTNALSSRTAAAQQALIFQNANTAYGPQGCNA